jgi:hypothetical protein
MRAKINQNKCRQYCRTVRDCVCRRAQPLTGPRPNREIERENMKNMNKLVPLTTCDSTPGEFEPALIPSGFKFRRLVAGGLTTADDHQGWSFRRDLVGLVRECGGLPIVQLDDGGVFAVQHPDEFMRRCW